MWARIHTNLQRVCIDLWKLPQEARHLVTESGVDSSQMIFDEPPALRWESIIGECEKQRTLNILCPVLLRRYPGNPILQAAVAPWIDGNPPEESETGKMPKGKTIDEPVSEDMSHTEPTTIVTETPTTTTTTTQVRKQRVEGTDEEVNLVPVFVPEDFAEDASVAVVATVPSLRLTVAQMQKDIDALLWWREEISRLSRAETAAASGSNESADSLPKVGNGKETE